MDAVTLSYDMEAGQRIEISEILEIKKPHLWNGITDPYRYQVNISVSENDEIIDSVISYIGIREYRVDKDSGFYLNGESYPLRGVAMHQDYEGMAMPSQKPKLQKASLCCTKSARTRCGFLTIRITRIRMSFAISTGLRSMRKFRLSIHMAAAVRMIIRTKR